MSHFSGLDGFINSRRKLNSVVIKAAKDYVGNINENNNKAKYKTNKIYQQSFKPILEFEKKFTDKHKKQINSVIFHKGNNDGYSCAYIAWKYLTKDGNNTKRDVLFIAIQPDFKKSGVSQQISRILNSHIKDKHVLMMDLNYNKETLDLIQQSSKSLIGIDNHHSMIDVADNIFSTTDHAACASVHKFLYPKDDIPLWVIYVDDSDMKLWLKFISDSNYFTVFMNVRLTKSHMLQKNNAFDSINGAGYKLMSQMLSTENFSWMVIAGAYMNEIQENYKGIIAKNSAYTTRFYGYEVVMANFEVSGMAKSVGRQMITTQNNRWKNSGKTVDFAVLWSYHQNSNEYYLQLVANHQSKKHNVSEIARRIASNSKYGTGRAGGDINIATIHLKCPPPVFITESQHKNKI